MHALAERAIKRMIFDGEARTDVTAALNLPWRERVKRGHALTADLIPDLEHRARRVRRRGPSSSRARARARRPRETGLEARPRDAPHARSRRHKGAAHGPAWHERQRRPTIEVPTTGRQQ